MCGIAGFIDNKEKSYEAKIKTMCDKISFRGPDGFGMWHEEDVSLTIGHRRLSILDLSEAGSQPMLSISEKFVISFNGEIYNYKEVKREIEKKIVFLDYKSTSDTAVLVEAFEHLGIKNTLNLIRGMFVIALYDRRAKSLYLIRDRMGEKPLYYGWKNNAFLFGSTLDVITAYTGKLEIEPISLLQYLCYGCVPGELSIYSGFYKLLPGEIMQIDCLSGKTVEKKKYYDVCNVSKEERFANNEETLTQQFENILYEVIKEQMVADVPVGAYLSGGVDSSLVVAMMQRQSSSNVRTYTIGIEGHESDEAPWAQKIADVLGVNHTVEYISKSNMLQGMMEMGKTFCEPFADPSQVPTYMVSKLARKDVTVTLSGDGGDELFCGYDRYMQYLKWWNKIQKSFKYNIFTYWVSKGILFCPKNIFSNRALGFKNKYEANSLEEFYRAISESKFVGNSIVKGTRLKDLRLSDTPLQLYSNEFLSDYENLMMIDQLQYLPDDILVKVDRTGMAVSLENRIPLLDKRIVEFAWKTPISMKYDGISTKKIMRNVLYKYVPKELIERPKQGFSFPAMGWLLEIENLKKYIKELCETVISGNGILNKKIIKQLWDDYERKKSGDIIIWRIVMLLLWAEERDISL